MIRLKQSILKIKLFLFLFSLSLSANSYQSVKDSSKNIAYISASSLYEVDYNKLNISLKDIIEENSNIEAIVIIDALSNKEVFKAFKFKGRVIYNKTIPNAIKKCRYFEIKSMYDNEKVGTVKVFYEEKPKTNLTHLTQNEVEYLKNRKKLRVCVESNWLPYESNIDGKFIGISADYLNLISKKLNIDLEILKPRSKDCDIKSIRLTNGECKFPSLPTRSYINDYIVLVTEIEQPFINNLNNYLDKKFVVAKAHYRLINYAKKKIS